MTCIRTLIITITLLFIHKSQAEYGNQMVTLYSGEDGTGDSVVLKEHFEADLHSQNFDNKAKSACITGAWLFYENPYFNEIPGRMEYAFGNGNDSCINFKSVGGFLSSLRFAGWAQSYQSSTLTLYRDIYFQGHQELSYIDLENITPPIGSFIINGLHTWTFYSQPNFTGNALCIKPPLPHYTPAFISTLGMANLTSGAIKSAKIRHWCNEDDRNLEVPSFIKDQVDGVKTFVHLNSSGNNERVFRGSNSEEDKNGANSFENLKWYILGIAGGVCCSILILVMALRFKQVCVGGSS